MAASEAEAALVYTMHTIVAEWQRVQPPDFWTHVKHVEWPPFEFDEDDRISTRSTERNYVLLFQDEIGENAFAEPDVGFSYPFLRVLTCTVVRDSGGDLQYMAARAAVDMQQLYLGNPDRMNPDYAGPNTWGIMTRQTPNTRIRIRRPKVAGDGAVSLVRGSFDVGYISPWPKG